jgi:hypothetical protein
MSARIRPVSIGVPVYNGQRYLADALDSLLAQTFTDFEVIISDNGSTDGTEDICRRYAAGDARIRYVRQPENRGAIWNFNHVFELARGEYYRWHAHDDLCASTFLQRCLELLDNDPGMVLCHTQKATIDPEGRIWGVRAQRARERSNSSDAAEDSYQEQINRGRAAVSPCQRFRTVLLGPSFCLDCFGLLRSSALRQTRLILPFFGSEKVLSAELALLGRCGRIPEPLFFLRDHAFDGQQWKSAEQQQAYVGTKPSRRFSLTRLQLLWGHATAVWRAPLSGVERARCLAAVLQYVLQLNKWKRALREMFTGAPLKSDEQLSLTAPRPPETIHSAPQSQ